MTTRTSTTHTLILMVLLLGMTACLVTECRAMAINARSASVARTRDLAMPGAARDVIESAAAVAEEPPIWLSRRYWGDEMSSCIEIYCLRHLGGEQYLNCLQNYCPDAVVRVLPRRQVSDDNGAPTSVLMTSLPSSQFDNGDDDEGHMVSVTCSPTRRLHCIGGALCYVTSGSSSGVKPSLSVSASRCVVAECNGAPAFRQCVQLACC